MYSGLAGPRRSAEAAVAPMLARGLVALAVLASLRSSSAQSSTPACYYIRVSTPISNLGYSATLTSLGNCATSTVKCAGRHSSFDSAFPVACQLQRARCTAQRRRAGAPDGPGGRARMQRVAVVSGGRLRVHAREQLSVAPGLRQQRRRGPGARGPEDVPPGVLAGCAPAPCPLPQRARSLLLASHSELSCAAPAATKLLAAHAQRVLRATQSRRKRAARRAGERVCVRQEHLHRHQVRLWHRLQQDQVPGPRPLNTTPALLWLIAPAGCAAGARRVGH